MCGGQAFSFEFDKGICNLITNFLLLLIPSPSKSDTSGRLMIQTLIYLKGGSKVLNSRSKEESSLYGNRLFSLGFFFEVFHRIIETNGFRFLCYELLQMKGSL